MNQKYYGMKIIIKYTWINLCFTICFSKLHQSSYVNW